MSLLPLSAHSPLIIYTSSFFSGKLTQLLHGWVSDYYRYQWYGSYADVRRDADLRFLPLVGKSIFRRGRSSFYDKQLGF